MQLAACVCDNNNNNDNDNVFYYRDAGNLYTKNISSYKVSYASPRPKLDLLVSINCG